MISHGLDREGVVNGVPLFLGIVNRPTEIRLYTPSSRMWALWFLYIVFMIGPIYYSMRRIDEDVMSAAAVVSATRNFSHILPAADPARARLAARSSTSRCGVFTAPPCTASAALRLDAPGSEWPRAKIGRSAVDNHEGRSTAVLVNSRDI